MSDFRFAKEPLARLATIFAFLPRLERLLGGTATTGAAGRWSTEEFQARLLDTRPPLVVDVRTRADFEGPAGHIDGALNLPLEDIDARLAELRAHRGSPIAIVCTTDRRSDKAAAKLAAAGFLDAHVVANGMTGWRAAGLPTSSASTAPDAPALRIDTTVIAPADGVILSAEELLPGIRRMNLTGPDNRLAGPDEVETRFMDERETGG